MRRLCMAVCLAVTSAKAQLPDAPKPATAWALNFSINAKYSLTKSMWDSVPKLVLDYRFPNPRYRVGLEYSHAVITGDNAVAASLNYKLAEWGKRR